jgi:hypothetical protein
MLPRALSALAIFAVVVVGCGDLFHGTNWSTLCDTHPSAPACSQGSGGGAGGSTSSSPNGGSSSMGGAGGSTTASATSSGGSTSGTGGGGGVSPVGCSDGAREGFTDMTVHPTIAGCSGGFSVPGVATAPACGRFSGNDSTNPTGVGCSIGDLCAAGWHVCTGPADVAAHSANGCTDAATATGLFFATQTLSSGSALCDGGGHNDIFGCGSLGAVPDPVTCTPLDRFSSDLCAALAAPWVCGTDNINESKDVTKTGPDAGGAICCTD